MVGLATPRPAESGLVAVAYSGGRDSTALLHATALQAKSLNEAGANVQVLALHVHHGLSAYADDWLKACQQQCESWSAAGLPVRFLSTKLADSPTAAQSIEAWAREQRYAALTAMAKQAGADLVLLAHHQRDQAETLLLQALRGAGVAGLAAMPSQQWRDGICWARPWLNRPREAIESYVLAHGLAHLEDDSNSDPRFARNRLRLSVWPALAQAFPQAQTSLAQAATWAQQALALQQEIASADLVALASLASETGLAVEGLLALSPARASNALRAWLAAQLGRPAAASLVQRLMLELPESSTGTWHCGDGELRLYRGSLQWLAKADTDLSFDRILQPKAIDLSRVGVHPAPEWGGAWLVERVGSGGIELSQLTQLTQRARSGGEQFQLKPKGVLRSLKKVYQEQAVPAWCRRGPLLFLGEVLLFVPGLGLNARYRAADGLPQVSLAWRVDPG
ncbi:tRNA lysidine(34) synthetase TilS [Roseateles albus]|uniref:tRNA(Ile)-lysidine synthase n=1 Tax=Roseateles albus TaxID=2987525 RepID=A0ABT5KAF8_9BURK|nr:tRNA lysidine(34) synthetase TilS [Roseateles albus]MDC8770923.1 tRNA lysidine(34) synthetase TilS [Roseateles albus]